MNEEEITTSDKIKKHFSRHKEAYISGGVCFLIGAATTVILSRDGTLVSVKEYFNLKWHSPTTTQIIMPALGHPGNVVRCLETSTIYASQREAAKAFGVAPADMSRHLHGAIEHLRGNHFEVIGKAGHPLES
jgi:hypothetical protein